MFALALWDRTERTLTLARDRFGEKPLYWGRAGRALVFGSEVRALRAHPAFSGTIDRSALATYVQLGYVSGPRRSSRRSSAPARELPHLRAGRCSGPACRPTGRHATRPRSGASVAASDERGPRLHAVDGLLAQVIPSRLEADVPLGAFLSGGIDSSVVVAYAQAAASSPLRTFTMGFDDERYDETDDARAVAKHLGTDHTEVTVTGDDALAVVDLLPSIYDEPFADPSQIPTYLMCRLARREVTVALSGDGGDELFLGYDRYRWARDAWRVHRMLPPSVRAASGRGLEAVKAGTRLGDTAFRGTAPCTDLGAARSRAACAGAGIVLPSAQLALERPRRACRRSTGRRLDHAHRRWTFPEAAAVVDTVAYLPDDILVKVDRAAMASSLETRAPLLDAPVVRASRGRCRSTLGSMAAPGSVCCERRCIGGSLGPSSTGRSAGSGYRSRDG